MFNQGISNRAGEGRGKVYFVGAGPGDPEMLTRKAWKLLTAAEVVLHDALVPAEIVELAPSSALVINVGKRCGSKSVTQEEIHTLLIEHARAGRTVVRLQGGDPLIFGRAGEEIAALQHAGVEFEIVPGVTAASAAAAAAQISLTNRKVASKLIFLSGHRGKHGGANQDEGEWSSLPASDVTLAIYMPGNNYEKIASDLASAGWLAETPCVIVSQAGTAQQSILRVDLSTLKKAPEMPAPAILLVGAVTDSQALEAAGAFPVGAAQKNKGIVL
jgi:uroporphyrin-III C-methyltransferase